MRRRRSRSDIRSASRIACASARGSRGSTWSASPSCCAAPACTDSTSTPGSARVLRGDVFLGDEVHAVVQRADDADPGLREPRHQRRMRQHACRTQRPRARGPGMGIDAPREPREFAAQRRRIRRGAARRRDELPQRQPARIDVGRVEQALIGAQPLGQALGGIEAIDADHHGDLGRRAAAPAPPQRQTRRGERAQASACSNADASARTSASDRASARESLAAHGVDVDADPHHREVHPPRAAADRAVGRQGRGAAPSARPPARNASRSRRAWKPSRS